jgi:hypothetical protein
VIPKSVTDSRIEENFKEIELDQSDIDAIENIGKTEPRRFNIPYIASKPHHSVADEVDDADRLQTSRGGRLTCSERQRRRTLLTRSSSDWTLRKTCTVSG